MANYLPVMTLLSNTKMKVSETVCMITQGLGKKKEVVIVDLLLKLLVPASICLFSWNNGLLKTQ